MFGTIARCVIVLILAFSQCLRACADLSLLKTTSRINSFLNNGGQELIRRHLGLSKHVHYHPFAHFTRDEPSYSRDEAMRRIADAERVSDVQLLRSMGVYFPGIDHDSMLTSGQVSRQLNISRQFLNQRAVVRGKLSVFEVAYDPNTPSGVRRAFEYSLGIWGRVFKSKTPLRVRFKWEPFQGRTLAATQSPFSIVGGTPETPDLMSGTSYTPVLALVLQGTDFLPLDRFHISISFNSRQLWHTDLRQNAPAGRFDLATVALHEQCHALFFSGSALGRPQLGVANFESMDYLPSRFDHFMQTRKGVGVARSCAGADLFKALTTPGLRFRTTTGRSSFGLYAPRRYSRGSSTYHFAAGQLQRDCQSQNIPDSECSDLMTYELETQYTMRSIGEPTLRVMRSVLGSSAGLRKEKCVIPPALRGSEESGYQPGVLGPDAKSGKPFRLPMSVIITAGALGAVGTVTVIYFIVTAIVGRRS